MINKRNTLISDTVVAKLYEYQFSLIARRWQALLAYIVITGLMFNAYGLVTNSSSLGAYNKSNFIICFSSIGIVLSYIMVRIVNLMTQRIHNTQNHIISNSLPPIALGIGARITFINVTSLIFLTITTLSIPWFIVLYSHAGWVVTNAMIFLGVMNLFTVSWKTGAEENL